MTLSKIKIISIIGARPQFIKAAAISREIAKHDYIKDIIVHTGQHFDANMSDIFFEQMKISKPDYNLNINDLSHGAMTGRMIEKIEEILIKEKPDLVIVYGDTNSTLAGALAAKKIHIKVAHIEAGLRSYNMSMPEEINRILTDRISDILFCPTDTSILNLQNEGYDNFECKIINSGDVMLDTALFYSEFAQTPNMKLPEKFILTTIHRAENTDNKDRLTGIINALTDISEEIPIILPLHPRTKKILDNSDINTDKLIIIEPVGYLEMIYMMQRTSLIMTDSGGMQKEAFFFNKKCIILRDETEWTELTEAGYNRIAGAEKETIIKTYREMKEINPDYNLNIYGKGNASEIIVNEIIKAF